MRLRRLRHAEAWCLITLFQFHSGSIKTTLEQDPYFQEPSFNSTLVRLRRYKRARLGNGIPCFNSTLVRLRPEGGGLGSSACFLFQFHSGSIKTCRRAGSNSATLCFNSTLVRLRQHERDAAERTRLSFNSTLVRLRLRAQELRCFG